MDYFNDAFGGLQPQIDRDAAIKLSLDALVADHRIGDLTELVSPENVLGGIEGEPGWTIERRDPAHHVNADWPENADFRVYVNPDTYSLTYPEFYCDTKTFHCYIHSILKVYANRFPNHMDEIERLRRALLA